MWARIRRFPFAAALVVILAMLGAWAAAAPRLAGHLVVERPLDHADALFVMAGSRAYEERTGQAAHLYHKGLAPLVVLTNDALQTGWSASEQRNPYFVELAYRNLVAQGVPASAIQILPQKVSGTITEARLAATLAAERGWKSLLVVTSACHTRRTLWTFDKVFADAGVATRVGIEPAGTRPDASNDPLWWLTAAGLEDVALEYVKAVYYRMAY